MADTVLSIGLAQGVEPPNNPPPPVATPFDCVFERSLGIDESGQPIPAIRDVARGLLDASLVGSVTLPDAVPGSTAEVRFLSGAGALRELVPVSIPAAGVAFRLDLTAAQSAVIAAPDPRPPALETYVRRDVRLMPIDSATINFAALNLAVAPITIGGGGWVQLGLDKQFNL
ncbi:MAG: hypothetical protein WD359_06880, partial [Dehalococcoidia bacterium]